MKDISIETIIKNSNKEDFNMQIDFHSILASFKDDQLNNSPKNNGTSKDKH